MKIVRVSGGVVKEIIPDYATPVADYYGEAFARLCVEAPDEVRPNWYYDSGSNTFSKSPFIQPKPTAEDLAAENKLLKAQVQAQTERSDFLEDCIAEMAVQVYGE